MARTSMSSGVWADSGAGGRACRLAAMLSVALTLLGPSAGRTEARDLTPWAEPVPGMATRLIGEYSAPMHRYGTGHRGVDIAVDEAEQLSAPAKGRITFSGLVVDRSVVTLTDESGRWASFEPACGLLPVGTEVQRGQVIAAACEPLDEYERHCQMRCVHFSARINGLYLSPLQLLGLLEPSRLLPTAG